MVSLITNEKKQEQGLADEALRESEQKFRAIFNQAAVGIVHAGLDGKWLLVNQRFCDIVGYTQAELLNLTFIDLTFPDDIAASDENMEKLKAGQLSNYSMEKRYIHKDGTIVWINLSVTLLSEVEGDTKYYIGIIEDISKRKQVEEANERKSEYERTITNITKRFLNNTNITDEIINETLAQIGFLSGMSRSYIFLLRSKGTIMDNTHEWCAQGVQAQIHNLKNVPTSDFPWWLDQLKAGGIVKIEDVSKLPIAAKNLKKYFKSLDIKSILAYPLYIGGEISGFIQFDNIWTTNGWNEESFFLLLVVSDVIGNAFQRKWADEALYQKNQKMQKELDLAAKVQHELLPKELPVFAGLTVAWEFKPSLFASGDMFNIFQLDDNNVGFYILDVMGHGIPTALKAVTLNYLLKPSPYIDSYLKPKSSDNSTKISPAEILKLLNQHFVIDSTGSEFFTLFYGVLNTRSLELTYARAGHCPPLLIQPDGKIRELIQGGPAMGLSKDIIYQDYTISLFPGDKLVLYTDGITEARNKLKKSFSKDRFMNSLVQKRRLGIEQLISSAVREVMEYAGSCAPEDDITLLGLEMS